MKKELFLTFFKIGAFTFGGGYAMIPLIEKEVVEKKKWLTKQDILDVVAIAESTPGPIAVNAATFVGYKTAGIFGSVIATLGVVLPSFFIILLISSLLTQFGEYELVKQAFWGIRIGVLALIIKALVSMYKQCPKKILSYVIAIVVFVAVAFFHCSAIWAILFAAVTGLIAQLAIRKEQK